MLKANLNICTQYVHIPRSRSCGAIGFYGISETPLPFSVHFKDTSQCAVFEKISFAFLLFKHSWMES